MGEFFSDDLFSKKNHCMIQMMSGFHIGMEAWEGEQLCDLQSVFRLNILVGAGALGREGLGGRVGMGAFLTTMVAIFF